MVVVKYDSLGNQEWYKIWGGIYNEKGYGIIFDQDSDVFYITGFTDSFGTSGNMFLAKYNSEGFSLWNETWGEDAVGWDVALDSQGSVYIVGKALLKYYKNGTQIWANTDVSGSRIAIDTSDNLYVIDSNGDIILKKFTNSGIQKWDITSGGAQTEYAYGIAIDLYDEIYIAGSTESFGAGNYDMYLVKYLLTPGYFILSSDADFPDKNGSFNLNWDESSDADNYSVYVHNSYITKINDSVTLLEEGIIKLAYALSGIINGTYYYKVVAYNQYGNCSSNCISIEVKLFPPGNGDGNGDGNGNGGGTTTIDGYNVLILIGILFGMGIIFIKKRKIIHYKS